MNRFRQPRGRGAGRRLLVAWPALLGILAVAAGCSEEGFTGPVPEGQGGAETREVLLEPADMNVWRDTTFAGYAAAADAEFLLLADDSVLHARSLLKFPDVPDSVTVDSVRHAVAEYSTVRLRFLTDTAASTIPEGPLSLRLTDLEQDWDPGEVTWTRAAEGSPWSQAGGDLGRELGAVTLEENPDSALGGSLLLPVDEAVKDSLMKAWSRGDGGLGAALVVEGQEPRLRITGVGLEANLRPADLDTVLQLRASKALSDEPSTFIHDPPTPDSIDGLRVGGLPAHRLYFSFQPPDTVDGIPLREATISQAQVVFRPRVAPEPPFALDGTASAELVELVSDPFEEGPRTPLLARLGGRTFRADSLEAGRPARFGFTSLMNRWADRPDSLSTFHLGVRLSPDGQSLGFWEFGASDDSTALRPFVRLLVTPSAAFGQP